jgi:hypothetical protein
MASLIARGSFEFNSKKKVPKHQKTHSVSQPKEQIYYTIFSFYTRISAQSQHTPPEEHKIPLQFIIFIAANTNNKIFYIQRNFNTSTRAAAQLFSIK